jgi:hypothetical protein
VVTKGTELPKAISISSGLFKATPGSANFPKTNQPRTVQTKNQPKGRIHDVP